MKKSTLFIPAILCGMALIAETPVTAKTVCTASNVPPKWEEPHH